MAARIVDNRRRSSDDEYANQQHGIEGWAPTGTTDGEGHYGAAGFALDLPQALDCSLMNGGSLQDQQYGRYDTGRPAATAGSRKNYVHTNKS